MKSVLSLIITYAIIGFSQAAQALDVEVHVHNPCRKDGKQCFQMDVWLDAKLSATWITSPGKPSGGSFPGENTPEFNVGIFTSAHDKGYHSFQRGDAMPYAMHINKTGFAVHGSYDTVNGSKASHGCLRIKPENAAKLNAWVREANKTGGLKTNFVQDTTINYPPLRKK